MKHSHSPNNTFDREEQLLVLEETRRHAPKVDVEARWKQFEAEHLSEEAKPIELPAPVKSRRTLWVAVASLAACLVLGAVLLRPYLTTPEVQQIAAGVELTTERNARHLLAVAKGATHEMHLPDGTLVRLSPESRLHYPDAFSDNERRVELEGEAYFEVTPDAQRPFLVTSPQAEVRVLGTHFTVRAYPKEEYRVSLHEGRVAVTNRAPQHPETLTLNPGESAVVGEDASLTFDPEDRYHAMLLEGYFYYDNVTLGRIIEDLHRYYGIDFFVATDLDLPLHFKVKRSENVDEVLEQLNAIHGVRVSRVASPSNPQ